MKINVIYKTTDAPYGGGNQFLKALKKYFTSTGIYAQESEADVFLFNSHHELEEVVRLKNKYPNKKFVHRIDGPMRLYNSMSDSRDDLVYRANSSIADGTVYQSDWSKKANISLGMTSSGKSAVIHNAVDDSVFFYRKDAKKSKKPRIISASFSPNIKKGFPIYSFLDNNLDFSKYEMVFAGNSPVSFKNIKNVGCLDSSSLSIEMNNSHIYLTASENDPCSNSVLEAISCGLPCVAANSGGHPELVKDYGELFDSTDQVINCIEKVIKNREEYTERIKVTSITEVGNAYIKFFRSLL